MLGRLRGLEYATQVFMHLAFDHTRSPLNATATSPWSLVYNVCRLASAIDAYYTMLHQPKPRVAKATDATIPGPSWSASS